MCTIIKNISFHSKSSHSCVQEALSRGVLVYLPQILTGGAPILRLVLIWMQQIPQTFYLNQSETKLDSFCLFCMIHAKQIVKCIVNCFKLSVLLPSK
jgi:hypothetical protein